MEIRAAFDKLATQQNPDRDLNNSAEAERKLELLLRTKKVLTSANLRRQYDSKRYPDERSQCTSLEKTEQRD